MLPQQKFNKDNSLKYKPKPTVKVKEIAKETGNTKNRTYAEVLGAGRNLTGRLVKATMPTTNTNKTCMKNYAQ